LFISGTGSRLTHWALISSVLLSSSAASFNRVITDHFKTFLCIGLLSFHLISSFNDRRAIQTQPPILAPFTKCAPSLCSTPTIEAAVDDDDDEGKASNESGEPSMVSNWVMKMD
jgi:hypothetical protein